MSGNVLTVDTSVDASGRHVVGPGNYLPAGRRSGSTDYAYTHVEGQDAHDAAATAQPLQIGGVAESTVPSAVSDGDAVRAFFDTLGQLAVRLRGSAGAILLPDAAALADATSNPTLTQIAGFLHLFNGTTWDRARGDTTNGLRTQPPRVSTAAAVGLASSATSAQLLAANSSRRGLTLNNTDANDAFIYYGTTAVILSNFTARIPPGGYWEMPEPAYTGRIDVIWRAAGSGALIGSEL